PGRERKPPQVDERANARGWDRGLAEAATVEGHALVDAGDHRPQALELEPRPLLPGGTLEGAPQAHAWERRARRSDRRRSSAGLGGSGAGPGYRAVNEFGMAPENCTRQPTARRVLRH